MKITFKKALSIVLSLALSVMCLTGAFVSASAETITLPEKMLRITPQITGDAVSFRQQTLTQGHTYKLKMLQKGITGVIPRERVGPQNNWYYVNTSAVVGTEENYTTYTFTCAGDRTRLLFTTESAGTSGYIADVKLYDTTSGTAVNIDFTTMTFVYAADTYSNWLTDRTDPQAFTLDILNANIANINFIELLDFDADVMDVLLPPEKNTNYPEKQLKLTAPVFEGGDSNPYAVIFRASGLTAGHTYRLAMFQQGLLGVKYNLYANGTVWTQYSMLSVANGAYTIYQFTPTQRDVEIRFNIGGSGKTSYIADLKLYDIADPTTNLINDIATSENTTGWSKQMLNADQTSDVALGETVTVEDFNLSDYFFKSHSLVLAESIGVNFFLDLSGLTEAEKANSYMTFTVTNYDGTKQDEFDGTDVNGSGDYCFTCFLNSVQMAEFVTPTLHYGTGETLTGNPFSVKDYIDYIVSNDSVFPSNLVNLVKALGDYGHYAQIYLGGRNGWLAGTNYTAIDRYRGADYTGYSAYTTALSSDGVGKTIEGTAVTGLSYSLNFDSKTYVNVQLTTTDSLIASATVDDMTLFLSASGKLRTQALPILKLGEPIVITGRGTTNTNTFTITLSGLSYIRAILNSGSTSTAAKNTVAALYDYYTAACTYKGV